MKLRKILFPLLVTALYAGPVRADWPYLTEGASNLTHGQYSLSAGVGGARQHSSYLPGGKGTLWSLPQVEGRLGLGPRAEVIGRYEVFSFYPSDSRRHYMETGDLRLFTKVGLLGDSWRLSGLAGAKLPNAKDEHGLGTDNTDYFLSGLLDVPVGRALVSLNLGLGILGSVERNQSQDDVLTWGLSARFPVADSVSLGVEAAGMDGPWGIRTTRRFVNAAAVASWHAGPWRLDVSARRGFVDSLGWGMIGGVTYAR